MYRPEMKEAPMTGMRTCSFDIHVEGDLACAELLGRQDVESMIHCITQIHTDNNYKRVHHALFNLEDAQIEHSFGDLLQIADFTNRVGSLRGPSKWAFVARDMKTRGFVDRIIMLNGKNPVSMRRFSCQDEARDWLGVQVGQRVPVG